MVAKSELKPSCSKQVCDRLRQPSSPSHIHISTPIFFPVCEIKGKHPSLPASECLYTSDHLVLELTLSYSMQTQSSLQFKKQSDSCSCYIVIPNNGEARAAHFLSPEAFSRRLRGVLHDPLVAAYPSPLNVPENQALQKYLINGCNRKKKGNR